MGTEIISRSALRLVCISGQPNDAGLYYYSAFDGRQRITTTWVDIPLSAEHVEYFRKSPIEFISWCHRS